jgi:5,10-methylenetetrahydrofolate reductase
MSASSFDLVCEIEPPTRPDLRHVRHQIGVLAPVAHSFLIPDNHIGRATVSSIAVAHEVAAMGGRSIACLNSRDRNLLGFRRDMLTAAAYGVGEFLFVYGDKPTAGDRTSELTVRAMMDEARSSFDGPLRVGVASGLRPLPSWKRSADFVFAQISYSLEALLRWRESVAIDVPVYAGVMVLASATMAERLAGSIPDIAIPPELVSRVAQDRQAGIDAACEQIDRIRESGAFDGVHLVSAARYREMALRLESRP